MAVRFNTYRAKELMLRERIDTQAELAKLAEVNPNTMGTTFNNTRTPDLGTVERIARALKCSALELLIDEGYPAPQHAAPAALAMAHT